MTKECNIAALLPFVCLGFLNRNLQPDAQARFAVGGGVVLDLTRGLGGPVIPLGRLSVGLLPLRVDGDIWLLRSDIQLVIPSLVFEIPLLEPSVYVGFSPVSWLITRGTAQPLMRFTPKAGLSFRLVPFLQLSMEAFVIVERGPPWVMSPPGFTVILTVGL
jgi:hypothetical protein